MNDQPTLAQLKALATGLVTQGAALQYQEAMQLVLLCAVEALIASHPDPKRFALAFGQSWQRTGSGHANVPPEPQTPGHTDQPHLQGIDAGLSQLEQAMARLGLQLGARPER